MVGSSLAPKWPIVVSFYGIHHQKSNFLLILAPFLPEAVEANRCYFFENWVKKLKCPHLLKPLGTIFQHNYWSFYTSEPFTLARFNMRHPVHTYECIMTHQKAIFKSVTKNHEWNSIKRDLIISEQQIGFLSFMTFWIIHNSTMVLLRTWVLLAIFIHGTLGHFWVIVISSPDPTANFEFPFTFFYDLLTN